MNKKLTKALIFAAGAAVGAVVSAFVTNRVVEKTYRDAADEEIFEANRLANDRIKKYKDEIKELKEKISRQKVTINTLADQVREGKGDGDLSDILSDDEDGEDDPRLRAAAKKVERKVEDPRESRKNPTYTRYTGRYGGTKVVEAEEEDVEFPFDPDEEEDCIKENSPRLIDEDTFSNTAMSYSKEDLYFYIYDGKVVSEDGEWIENYQALTGPFDENRDAGDEIYIRNDELAVDYRIEFRAGYGEEAISMTDIWDEE